MKRHLILSFLASGATLMLGTAAQAAPSDTPAASPSAAEQPSGPGPRGGQGGGILNRLSGALELSGSQQAAIEPIFKAANQKFRDQVMADRKAMFDSVKSQIDPLLSADQKTKFAGLLDQFETGRGGANANERGPAAGPGPGGPNAPGGPGGGQRFGRRGGPGGPGGPEGPAAPGGADTALLQRLTTELGVATSLLTPPQQAQFAALMEKMEPGGAFGPGAGFGRGPDAGPGPGNGAPGAGGGRGFNRQAAPEGTPNGGPQGAPTGGGRAATMQRLTSELGLTEDQQKKIGPILETAHQTVQATRADQSLTPDQKMDKISAAMETAQSQIKELLNPDQQGKLDAAMKGGRPQGRKPRPANSPAPTTGTNS